MWKERVAYVGFAATKRWEMRVLVVGHLSTLCVPLASILWEMRVPFVWSVPYVGQVRAITSPQRDNFMRTSEFSP